MAIAAAARNPENRPIIAAMSDSPLESAPQLTQLLRRWQAGDTDAREELMGLVYRRVRAIANQSLQRHATGSMTPTELAHEALLRLLGGRADWADRRHFFHVVAQATRQVVVDHARRRLSDKRGAGQAAVPLSQVTDIPASAPDSIVLRVDEALAALAQEDPRQARVVELIYFGGFSRDEIGAALDISLATVDRDLRFARAWLKQALAS